MNQENKAKPITRVEIVKALTGAIKACNRMMRLGDDACLELGSVQNLTQEEKKRLSLSMDALAVAQQTAMKAPANQPFDVKIIELCNCRYTVRYLDFMHVMMLSEFLRQDPKLLRENMLRSEKDLGAKRQHHLLALATQANPE